MVHHVYQREQPLPARPRQGRVAEKAAEAREANEKILVELGMKRPSSHYHYGHEPRVKIRRFAASSGNKAAVDKYSKELGTPASESTVCGLKMVYCLTVQYKRCMENQ